MKNLKKWFEGLPKWLQIVVVVVVVAVITIVVLKLMKMINKPKNVKVNEANIPGVPNGQGGYTAWDPDPLARELNDNICSGYNLRTYPETTDKVNALPNDDAVRALYNHCINYYSYNPIRCLEGEWSDWEGSYGRALSRFKKAVNQG